MSTQPRFWRNQQVLPLIAEYYDSTPDEPADPERSLRRKVIEEIFLPARVVNHGLKRRPVRLPLHRRAQIESPQGVRLAMLRCLSLDRIDVALPAIGGVNTPEAPVVVSIEGAVPGLWWRFLGHVSRAQRRGRLLTIQLERTLGCLSSHRASHH